MVDAGMVSAVGQRPQRMSLANLASAQSLEMQYNPAELTETLEAAYQHLVIVGQSHEQLQYLNTKNHRVEFDLAFDALTGSGYDIMAARRFLLSLMYARRGAGDIRSGAPTRVLFIWPNLFTLQAQIPSVKIKHTRFSLSGQPTAFTASIVIEEIRDMRLHSEDVLAYGTQRPDAAPTT